MPHSLSMLCSRSCMAAKLDRLTLNPAQEMILQGCKQLHMLIRSPGAATTMQGSLLVIIALLLLVITSLVALLAPATQQQCFSLSAPSPTVSSAGGMPTVNAVQVAAEWQGPGKPGWKAVDAHM